MLALRYHVPGEDPIATEFNGGTGHTPQSWTWRDDRLMIVENEYNAWLQVSSERLQRVTRP